MRSAAWLVMLLLPLAGCIGGDEEVELVAFTAFYRMADGNAFSMSLEARPFLDSDLQVRDGYWLSLQSGPQDAAPFVQVLDSDLSVVRHSHCWLHLEGENGCAHHRIVWSAMPHPNQGIGGLLWGNVTNGDDGLLRVHDQGAPSDLEQFDYEYRPGSLWPERYVRSVPSFDHEEILWSLEAVEVGAALPALAPRPVVQAPTKATDALFPGAEMDLPGLPLTIADGLAALRTHGEAGRILDGGCVAFVRHFDWRGGEAGPLPVPVDPRRALPGQTYVDDLEFGLLDSSGAQSGWAVELHRDVLGEESVQVQPRDIVNGFTLASCADRQAATVGLDQFLSSLPASLQQGSRQSVNLGWAGCCHYPRPGPHDLFYSFQWWTEGEDHFRSAALDASTGLLTELSYKPGDQVDPA